VPLRLFSLRAYYFLSFASLGVYLPYLPRWLEARELRGVAMGALMAVLPAMGLVAPPAFGLVADALGLRGRLLAVACAAAGLAFGAIALASAAARPLGFAGLFVTMVVYAFFRSPMTPLADVIAMEEASTGSATYPRLRLWGSIGFLVTALGAGRLLDPSDPASIPLAISAFLLLAAVAALSLPARAGPTSSPAEGALTPALRSRAAGDLLRRPDFRVFLAASLLGQAAHSAYDLCFTLHLRDAGLEGAVVGLAWALGVVSEVLVMAFGAPIFDRFSPPRLMAVAFGGACVRWIFIAGVRDGAALLAAQPLHAVSFSLMWLASLAFIKERVPPGILATGQGLFTASLALGSVAGMLVWGAVYRRAGGPTMFAIAAAVAACACALAALLVRRSGGGAAKEEGPRATLA
jgi:PPP family 3-phenylpropionic acid transporter